MMRIGIGIGIFLGAGLMLGVFVSYLPLEVIMAGPLGYFTKTELAPSHRIRARVANADDFWRGLDAFALAHGQQFFGPPKGLERVRDEYGGVGSYSFNASLVGDVGSVSFFSLPPKHPPLDPLVAEFKASIPGLTFDDYAEPGDVKQSAR